MIALCSRWSQTSLTDYLGGEDGAAGLNLLHRADGRVLNLGAKNSISLQPGVRLQKWAKENLSNVFHSQNKYLIKKTLKPQAKISRSWSCDEVTYLSAKSFLCLRVSPYRTCSASSPREEGGTEERRTQARGPRPSAGAWKRLSLREAASLNTEWRRRECEQK